MDNEYFADCHRYTGSILYKIILKINTSSKSNLFIWFGIKINYSTLIRLF